MKRVVSLAAVLAVALAGVVRADTTVIGSTTLPAGGAQQGLATGQVAFQLLAGDTNYVVSAPVSGTVTSWSFRNGIVAGGEQLRLRILRPTNVGPTQFTAVGTSTPQTTPDGLDLVRGPFAVNLPIQAGDRIAIENVTGGNVPVISGVTGADEDWLDTPSLADNSSSTFTDGNGGIPNLTQLLVQATITFTPSASNPPPPTTPPTTPVDQSLASLAPPVEGKSVDVAPVSGTVLVRIAPSTTFVALAQTGKQIPLGAEIDVTHGRIRLTAAKAPNSAVTKTADFYGGRFRVTQPPNSAGRVDLTLTGPLARCAALKTASAAVTNTKRKPRTRFVWGSGHGTFRTVGQRGSAAVRGTIWLVEDRCDGSTLVVVRRGVVAVRDDVRHRTILVKAGHRYLVRP